MDVTQGLEDLLEELVDVQKSIKKLKTKSVSGGPLRKQVKEIHKRWLPVLGILESEESVDIGQLQEVAAAWKRLAKLADAANPKAQYKAALKSIISITEGELLHSLIKHSAIQTIGNTLRKLVQPVSEPDLLNYLDESIRCAEANCVRGSVVLAWCAVAHKVQQKLVSLGLPVLGAEFARMKADKGLMFRAFTKDYSFSTNLDVQEAPDAHLILLCRFLTWLDDTQYKHLKAALDLRNGCGHPTGYKPDPVKLHAYYVDITQLVLLNPKFS
jgi:hypothetical protein